MEENSSSAEGRDSKREPVDEIELKKSLRSIIRALNDFWDEVCRRRNRNALWKF
jgi:hypothetical protein